MAVSKNPADSITWGTNLDSPNVSVFFAPDGVKVAGITSEGFSTYEIERFEAAFAEFSAVANLSFEVSTNAKSDFRIVLDKNEMEADTDGQMSPPGEKTAGAGAFNGTSGDRTPGGSLEKGGYEFMVIIHEVLHSLGLSHPHDDGGTSTIMLGVSSDSDLGKFDLNQGVYTAMTYNNGYMTGEKGSAGDSDKPFGYEGGPMALDIAVLQSLYGANMETATGNNTYSLYQKNESGTHWQSIWDAGGTDEIKFSGSRDAIIDLRAATLKYEVGGGGFVSTTKGIAGGYTIANGVIIENGTGGSGDDSLIGNGVANILTGNAGADSVSGRSGDDTLKGGAGADELSGNKGNDRIQGGDGADAIFGNGGTDHARGGSGNDSLKGGLGDDLLKGNLGDDKLVGGAGDDVLQGNSGDDTMRGGAGSDSFEFNKGHDKIVDFTNDVDTIVLHASLWGGAGKTIADILDMAAVVSGDAVFDFGNGNSLTLAGVSDLASLSNDITLL